MSVKADLRITLLFPESCESALASLMTKHQLALPFWDRSRAAGDVLARLVRQAVGTDFEPAKGAFAGGPGAPLAKHKAPVALKRGQPPPPPLDE